MDYLQKYPTYGPQRVSNELARSENGSLIIGHTAIYGIMKRHQLNTKKRRLEWVRKLNGEVVKLSELQRDKELSEARHIKADYPGALVGIDTFYVGCLKNLGRIYQVTTCDCFSSFGWAKLYLDKSARSAIDFMENHLLPLSGPVTLHRLLHDGGKEFTTHWEGGTHKFHNVCEDNQLRRTQTKVRHPWTNGYVERLNQTILDKFYSVTFRKKIYTCFEELQRDLGQFMYEYNFNRTHQGYKLKEHGFKIPAEAFFSNISCLALPEAA